MSFAQSDPKQPIKWPWILGGFVALIVIAGVFSQGEKPPETPAVPVVKTTEAVPTNTAATCTVPDVVGMVHQTAQDTMQASGLYFLTEHDATGRGRMLVSDRNWVTTAQSIAAGQVVECATPILLSAKKIGE